MLYEAVFYNGWMEPPGYFLITTASGNTPEQALSRNLARITSQVRKVFDLDQNDVSDSRLQETIYLLRENGLVPARTIQTSRKIN